MKVKEKKVELIELFYDSFSFQRSRSFSARSRSSAIGVNL